MSADAIPMPEPKGLTPAERTLWMVRTRPEVLDHMAFQLWYDASDYFPNGVKAQTAWEATSANDKQPWRDRVLSETEEFAAMTDAQRSAMNRMSLNRTLLRNDRASDGEI